ncbi:MAG: phycobiliprotein lyase [Synechococcus sp.]|nr:phycobiliprotein lyase [Synechococcus sp.]
MDTISDALSFFRLSCGRWRSQRSQHHLLHRQAEAGLSIVEVAMVELGDPRLETLAKAHGRDPAEVIGGCQVRWSASMAWDREGESHENEAVFGLIPTDGGLGREGLQLRDRGYAETAPALGHFRLDEDNSLWLSTSYETMNAAERFWFAGPNTRLRTSTVEGLSNTASLCVETRILDTDSVVNAAADLAQASSLLGW